MANLGNEWWVNVGRDGDFRLAKRNDAKGCGVHFPRHRGAARAGVLDDPLDFARLGVGELTVQNGVALRVVDPDGVFGSFAAEAVHVESHRVIP